MFGVNNVSINFCLVSVPAPIMPHASAHRARHPAVRAWLAQHSSRDNPILDKFSPASPPLLGTFTPPRRRHRPASTEPRQPLNERARTEVDRLWPVCMCIVLCCFENIRLRRRRRRLRRPSICSHSLIRDARRAHNDRFRDGCVA